MTHLDPTGGSTTDSLRCHSVTHLDRVYAGQRLGPLYLFSTTSYPEGDPIPVTTYPSRASATTSTEAIRMSATNPDTTRQDRGRVPYYRLTTPGPHEALALQSTCPACGATIQPAAVLDDRDCRQTGHSCRCGTKFTESWPAVAVTQ